MPNIMDPKCNTCDYNGVGGNSGGSGKPVPPIIPGTNYQIILESSDIPDNLLEYYIEALIKRGVETSVVNPIKGRLKLFFDKHKYDYTNGNMLLAFCIIVEASFKTRDYKVPIVHIMKDHLERSGYADGGNVVTDVFFMEVF